MGSVDEIEQTAAIRRRSRRIIWTVILGTPLLVIALVVVLVVATAEHSARGVKCGEVYGYGNSRIGINDADDCMGRDPELREDGQFRSTKQHCRALTQAAAEKDARCQKATRGRK